MTSRDKSLEPQSSADRIRFVVPGTRTVAKIRGDRIENVESGEEVGFVRHGVPRFVTPEENYCESFGFQWNSWTDERSKNRGSALALDRTIRERTQFDQYDTNGKTILECGMGGGDDTEVLLSFPFAEVHAFDLSTAVERAVRFICDDRLTVSQASIYEIPYPDESFDFVYCHRVLQHTPDPIRALTCICRKVKPGGVLFAHAYKRSWRYMLEWRYKYRWLTKRLPMSWIHSYVNKCGPFLHQLNNVAYRMPFASQLAYNFIPFYHKTGVDDPKQTLELEKLITFDALTPAHDHPMRSSDFIGVIESEGFHIDHLHDPPVSPIYCTAVRRR